MYEQAQSTESQQPQTGHDHTHAHAAGHGHDHSHGHGHGHGHDDQWSGEDYWKRPGVKQTAIVSHDSVVKALLGAGYSRDDLSKLDILEVGCGAGAVTPHFAGTFKSVHAIDTSPSMLQSFVTHLPEGLENVTYSLHAISPTSPGVFASHKAQPAPTPSEPERTAPSPRAQFDVAIANLVLHHVDQVDPFMQGMIGVVKPGGWIVFTEFGVVDGDTEGQEEFEKTRSEKFQQLKDGKKTEEGSVNRPDHFHKVFTPETITDLLKKYGLVETNAVIDGRLPVFPDEGSWPHCLIARGRKSPSQ